VSALSSGLKIRNLDASQFGGLSATGVANEVNQQKANICIELTFNIPDVAASAPAVAVSAPAV
jgi:hypothetical protein